MKFFNFDKKNQKLISLLINARVGFNYDHKGVKNRLLANIEEQQLSMATQKVRELTHKSFLRRHRFMTASLTAIVIIAATGATFAEADISKPGDKLHAIDLMQEQIIMKLPLTQTLKAKYHAHIVKERNQELEYLTNAQNHKGIKAQAVKESKDSLDNAIEQIKTVQQDMANRGKTEQAAKLNQVLTKLETLAAQQEQSVSTMKDRETNPEVKKQLETELEGIKKARIRAKAQ